MTGIIRGRHAIAALAASLVLGAQVLGAHVAAAETSSWAGRVDGPAAPIQRKAPAAKPGAMKIIKTVPQTGGTQEPAPASPPPKSSAHAKATPPGDDAAYEAFDQGQYVTALQLAVKAAERGQPQAHTLVGRIYADGLGTSQELRAGGAVVRARRRARRSRGHAGLRADAGGRARRRPGPRGRRPLFRGRRRRPSIRSPITIWRCCSCGATASPRTRIAP